MSLTSGKRMSVKCGKYVDMYIYSLFFLSDSGMQITQGQKLANKFPENKQREKKNHMIFSEIEVTFGTQTMNSIHLSIASF